MSFPPRSKIRIGFALALFAMATNALSTQAICGEEVSFDRDIQPIFAEHCLQCHGPDAGKRKADLRLDLESSAKESAIVAGMPDDSELIARLISDDPDTRMPPGKAEPLTAEQIEMIRRWIHDGAAFERHWAFQPIKEVPPHAANPERTTIDQYITAKLWEQGLQLSPPASKQQLIRRATFDLTGLPPTWQEVEDFVSDEGPDAFAKVIDRLLDSTAYGERWGRHWLDLARYADTHGGAAIGFKRFAFSYTYRDYVINAFNDDTPYDQFIKQQLAADQLGLPDNAAELAALGFLTVGMQFRNPHDTIDDQIDVVSRGLLGLTVSCARCHDHKFDDISTRDYYSLYATFASSERPVDLPLIGEPTTSEELQSYQAELKRRQTSVSDMSRDQTAVMRARLRMQVGLYLREIARGAPEQDLSTTNIFSYRTDDIRPAVLKRWQKYMRQMPETDAVFGPWVQLSRLPDAEFSKSCKALTEKLQAENGELPEAPHRLSTKAPRWNPRVLTAILEHKPTSMLEVADAYGDLFTDVQREWLQSLLEAALEATPGATPIPDEDARHLTINSDVNRQLRRHLYDHGTPTNVEEKVASRLLNRPINDNLNGRRESIHNLNLTSPGSPARAMVLREESSPTPFHVFLRGNPISKGDAVNARFLESLGGSDQRPFTDGQRRLDLANAIVHPDNPLTRRVIVNWVWQRHFGRGLVRTPDDFGTRGDRPTHPALLDYLATTLLQDDWSLKQLHRRIMLSDVYQQASIESTDARRKDPDNQLLWRMPRRRLELEAMRDAMLAASGELTEQRAGRPFELQADPIVPRRSVYAFVNRDIVDPLMSTFDAANPNACTAKRPATTVPQQTLFALNSAFIQDRAVAMVMAARHAVSNGADADSDLDRQLITELYRRAFARNPDNAELQTALAYVQHDSEATEDSSDSNPASNSNPSEARWHHLAHILLAANEFVFID